MFGDYERMRGLRAQEFDLGFRGLLKVFKP